MKYLTTGTPVRSANVPVASMSDVTGYDQTASYPGHQYYEPGGHQAAAGWGHYHQPQHHPQQGDNSPTATQRYPYYDNRYTYIILIYYVRR